MITYELKCLTLAREFLQDYDVPESSRQEIEGELAAEIQCAVEDWLNESGLPTKEAK